jgi:hypothetical protein
MPTLGKKITFWADNIPGKTVVILVSGKMGTGKTTFSELLLLDFISKVSSKVTIYRFASPIKKYAKECFMWNSKKDSAGRKLLQDIGSIGREYYQDSWVDYFIKYSENHYENFYIVDDWRFLNEYEKLTEYGFDVITVKIISNVRGEDDNHASEHGLPENFVYDYIIDNSSDFEDLRIKTKEFVRIITERE